MDRSTDRMTDHLNIQSTKSLAGLTDRLTDRPYSSTEQMTEHSNSLTGHLLQFHFHHVGLACRKLSSEILSHQQLGYLAEEEPFYDPIQRIRGVFMVHGPMRIELLEPSAEDSPVTKILAHGHKMYHQAFTCEDIYKGIQYLEAQGARVISPPAPAVAFNGKEIVFLIMRSLLIVELIEF